MAPRAESMKGILILFVDLADGGGSYARDTAKIYNPKIKKVSLTIDGNPNQLFVSGISPHQHFHEIRKHFQMVNIALRHMLQKNCNLLMFFFLII